MHFCHKGLKVRHCRFASVWVLCYLAATVLHFLLHVTSTWTNKVKKDMFFLVWHSVLKVIRIMCYKKKTPTPLSGGMTILLAKLSGLFFFFFLFSNWASTLNVWVEVTWPVLRNVGNYETPPAALRLKNVTLGFICLGFFCSAVWIGLPLYLGTCSHGAELYCARYYAEQILRSLEYIQEAMVGFKWTKESSGMTLVRIIDCSIFMLVV